MAEMKRATTLRLPVELHQELQSHAVANDLSMQQVIRRALSHYLDRYRPQHPQQEEDQ